MKVFYEVVVEAGDSSVICAGRHDGLTAHQARILADTEALRFRRRAWVNKVSSETVYRTAPKP